MSLFHAGLQPALDSNGDPISGAVWQFTATGTTTAVAVYADSDLATSLGSTVEADSAGRFVDVYFDDSVTCRARLWADDTLTGTPIKDIDPVNEQGGSADVGFVDVESYGADNTGVSDSTAAFEAALVAGNVSIGPGTFLISANAVCPPSNRRIIGSGMGRTIIKRGAAANRQSIFVIATDDFDGATFAARDVKNIEIAHMTLDFNFSTGWRDFACPIKFWAPEDSANIIRNIEIHHIEFIDSAGVAHPGGANGDAWCIETSAYNRTGRQEIRIHHCISYAEGHQMIAGGGTGGRNIFIEDNVCFKPDANGITQSSQLSAAYHANYLFDGVFIRRNSIINPDGVGIFVGPDGTQVAGWGGGEMRNVDISENWIHFDDYAAANVQGIFLRPYESGFDQIRVSDNRVSVGSDFPGGSSLSPFNIEERAVGASNTTTSASFVQPAVEATVVVSLTSVADVYVGAYVDVRATSDQTSGDLISGNWYTITVAGTGDWANVGAPANTVNTTFRATASTAPTSWGSGTLRKMEGGLYAVTATGASTATLRLLEAFVYSAAGATIPSGATVIPLGGLTTNLKVEGNDFQGGTTRIKYVNGGTVSDNNMDAVNIFRCPAVTMRNNSLSSLVVDGDVNAIIMGNDIVNADDSASNGVLVVDVNTNSGWAERAQVDFVANAMPDYRDTPKTNKPFIVSGTAGVATVRVNHNLVPQTADVYVTGTLGGAGNVFGSGSLVSGSMAPVGKRYYVEATLDFDLTSVEIETKTVTVSGIAASDKCIVHVIPPTAAWSDIANFSGYVSAANTITIKAERVTGTTPNPASGTFAVVVEQLGAA